MRALAGGSALFDAHVHFGVNDPAGLLATEQEALDALALVGSGALVFPLREPGGYREANQRALQLAAGSDGSIRALARLDPPPTNRPRSTMSVHTAMRAAVSPARSSRSRATHPRR